MPLATRRWYAAGLACTGAAGLASLMRWRRSARAVSALCSRCRDATQPRCAYCAYEARQRVGRDRSCCRSQPAQLVGGWIPGSAGLMPRCTLMSEPYRSCWRRCTPFVAIPATRLCRNGRGRWAVALHPAASPLMLTFTRRWSSWMPLRARVTPLSWVLPPGCG